MIFRFLKNKISTCLLIGCLCFTVPAFSSEASNAAYFKACNAYAKGDWNSAVFLLRKAVAYSENYTPDSFYMLISAEIYSEDSVSALNDCDTFLNDFSTSFYVPRIKYLRGKLLYGLGEYEKAVVGLSDFCHQNPTSELYPTALFYIGESLYADYKYDEAEAIYETIITKYPENDKVAAAQYRMESIAQRSREEKLLYLLKQTGEEYLAAKEDYEKQLKYVNSEAITATREKLTDSLAELEQTQQHNQELLEHVNMLEESMKSMESEIAELRAARELTEASLQEERDKQLKEKLEWDQQKAKEQHQLEAEKAQIVKEKDEQLEKQRKELEAEKLAREKDRLELEMERTAREKDRQEAERDLLKAEQEKEKLLAKQKKDLESELQSELSKELLQKDKEILELEKQLQAEKLRSEKELLQLKKDLRAELEAEYKAKYLKDSEDLEAELEAKYQKEAAELEEQLNQEKVRLEKELKEKEAEQIRIQQEKEMEQLREQQEKEEAVRRLKEKAKLIQDLMDSNSSGDK